MSMGRDVISAVDCAPLHPLQSLTSQLSSVSSQLQDIPSFHHKVGSSSPSPSQSALHLPVLARPQSVPVPHAAQVRGDGAHAAFVSQFNEGPVLHHQSPPPQLFRPQLPSPQHDGLAEQLMRMEVSKQHQQHQQQQQQHHHQQQHQAALAHQQADEFERIYRQPQGPQQWLTEYGAQQQLQQHQQQQQQQFALHQQQQAGLHALHQQIITGPSQWAAEFDTSLAANPQLRPHLPPRALHASLPFSSHYQPTLRSLPYLPPPSSLPMHLFQQQPPTSFSPSQSSTVDPKIVEVKDDTQSSPSLNVHSVPPSAMLSQFPAPAPQEDLSTSSGLGSGLSAEMIDRLMASDDQKWRNSRFLQFISKIKAGEIEFKDNQAVEREKGVGEGVEEGRRWAEEYEADGVGVEEEREREAGVFPSGWAEDFEQREGLRPLSTAEDYAKMAAGWSGAVEGEEDEKVWEEEYRRVVNGEVGDELDEEKEWERSFQQPQDVDDFIHINWQAELEKAKQRPMGDGIGEQADLEYHFTGSEVAGQFGGDAGAAFQEGVRLLEKGELKPAIAAFEAAVRVDAEHSDAWCYLGSAQAENEEESNAIAALLKAVAIDPYNLKALMMLGVSYTNDLEVGRALNYLKTWLENNADYQHSTLATSQASLREYQQFYGDPTSLHDQVTSMFLSAVSLRPADPDLHTVMGVLYHLSSDFDKAIDSFKQAIKHRPNDPQLWNKLGATLANSSKSADAVHAYKRALTLRPRYVRALANLAISYANQGMHEEAVSVYLKTLECNADAAHVWSYLRISLSHLGKEKLVELTNSKNVQLFRPYYDF